MNALHSVRQNYIATEASEKIRRALRYDIHNYADVVYDNGNKLLHKKKDGKVMQLHLEKMDNLH